MERAKRITAMLLAASLVVTGTVPAFAETIPESMEEEAVAAVAEEAAAEGTDAAAAESAEDGLLLAKETPVYERKVTFNGSKWMESLDHDIPLSKITVPGSHDAGTFNIRFGAMNKLTDGLVDRIEGWIIDHLPKNSFLTAAVTRTVEFIAGGAILAVANEIAELVQKLAGRCQSLTIREQLDQGVRAFDLRFRYEEGQFNVYHGDMSGVKGFFFNCECYDEYGKRLTIESVLKEIDAFLTENYGETVFLTLKNEGGTYDLNTEIQLYELERKYGVEMRFAKRSYSSTARERIEGISGDDSYYDVNSPAYTHKNFYGRMLDVSGSVSNAVTKDDVRNVTGGKTGDEWVVTCDQKTTLFENSLKAPKNKLEERQTNVQVKILWFMDPMDECGLKINMPIKWKKLLWFLPEIPVPTGLSVEVDSLMKTPLGNAENINPRITKALEEYVKNAGHEGNGLGIVSMDFQKEGTARAIANVNRTTGYGPIYTQSTTETMNTKTLGADGEDTGSWDDEYKRLEAITEVKADFENAYNKIAEKGYTVHAVSYDGDGNLVYETVGDAVKMINITMDSVSIPLDYVHVYAPVTKEYPQARITVEKRFLNGLTPGVHSFVVFFTDGSEAASVVIPERVYENRADETASFTGTWEKPVTGGRWYTDPAGNWHYENNGVFRDTWGYIVDPASGAAQWFLFDKGGTMLSGWQMVSGKWYYLSTVHDGSFGACLLGPARTPDGYEVDETGAWTGR